MYDEHSIPPIDTLPGIYRVVSTSCVPTRNERGVEYRVELYHDKAQMTVQYTRSQPDVRLKVNMLVSVPWKLPAVSLKGAIQISRLVILEHPIKGINLFESVPPRWVKDRALIRQAREVLDALPNDQQHLVVAILWDGKRFRQFCESPSSISDHHAYRNGNLRQTVEVAEMVGLLSSKYPQANLGISLTAAILHDVGKAAEYSAWGRDNWAMSDRGKLVSHRHTVIEWIAQAMATNRILMPERHYLSLLHDLTSAPNAEWLGIRTPFTPEAILLSMADRLSGESAMTEKLANKEGGWGESHPHRKGRPFTLQKENLRVLRNEI